MKKDAWAEFWAKLGIPYTGKSDSGIIIMGGPYQKRFYCLYGVCSDCGGVLEERGANSYYCKHCRKVVDSGKIRLYEHVKLRLGLSDTQANDGDIL